MSISMDEIADLYKKAVQGEVKVALANPKRRWDETYCGDVEFLFGDWRIVFFNDCDELDYTDSVTAPDGRTAKFSDWGDEIECPLDLLSGSDFAALEKKLSEAL